MRWSKNLIVVLALIVSLHITAMCDDVLKKRCSISLKEMNERMPGQLTFGLDGKLFISYRIDDGRKQSSSIWVSIFDVDNCSCLKKAKVTVPKVDLPTIARNFEVSPDGRLLLYVEEPYISNLVSDDEVRLVTLRADTLELLSTRVLARVGGQLPRITGFKASGDAVLLSYPSQKNIEKQLVTESVRLIELNPMSLHKVIREREVNNPFLGLGYLFDRNAAIWFSRDKRIVKSLVEYSPQTKQFNREISVDSPYGIGKYVSLPSGDLLFTSENDKGTPFSRVLQLNTTTQKVVKFDGCGFEQVKPSPNRQYVAGLCEARSQFEYNFGERVTSKLIVLQTSTLATVGVIPLSNKSGWHEFALGFRQGKVFCAVHENIGNVVVYEM